MRTMLRKMTLLTATGALADTATFDATATTQAALSVTCGTNLRFGTIAVEPSNAQATITVAASTGAEATSSSTPDAYPAASDSGPGECAVTNETGSDATASLSAATGTFAGTTLSGVSLSDGGVDTLSADIELSKASAITNETLFIGGTLTIPAAHTAFATYTGTITITVTD
jgi:hypothetical protein